MGWEWEAAGELKAETGRPASDERSRKATLRAIDLLLLLLAGQACTGRE